MAPPRLCASCGANLALVFDVDSHFARHLQQELGLPIKAGRRVSKFEDGAPLVGSLD